MTVRHPARFSAPLLPVLAAQLRPEDRLILDPFAGTGLIHELAEPGRRLTVGVELEPEWAALHPDTICADSLALLDQWAATGRRFDAIVTSPTYGNRMADHHNARDTSKRNTYRHALGRPLTPGNSGGLQWGADYQAFHVRAWQLVYNVLRPGGRFVLNVKDHIRQGQQVNVVAWHERTLVEDVGFTYTHFEQVTLPGNGFGQNGQTRVPYEWVLTFDKPIPNQGSNL